MKNSSVRVIFDTNLWISFLISKRFQGIDNLIKDEKIKLIFSKELLKEFITVVSRPKFEKYFSQRDIEGILYLFEQFGEMVHVVSNIEVCRDYKDNFLLNLAIDGKADFLLTGDNDLLVLKEIEKTKIVSMTQFLAFMN